MGIVQKLLRLLYVVYAFLIFMLLMIPVFLWSVLVLPLGSIKAGNLIYKACIVWADCWCFVVFIRHRNIFLEPLKQGQSYIFVSNHISWLDAAIIPKTFRNPVRPLGMVEMASMPLFGLIYKNVIVTVDRANTDNRAKSVEALKSVLRHGISILVFPEGGFNLTQKALKDFYDGAFRIAIETKTPIKPVLYLDTYRRMHYSSILSFNPGTSRSVFLPEITVVGLTTDNIGHLKNQVFQLMEQALIRLGADWIKA
ncbi:MAG: lysophospholipid acyltransferase family protein [Flavisolibacter sp.]